MKCFFCEEDIKEFDTEPIAYVIAGVTGIRKETQVHIHGTIEDKTMMIKIVEAMIKECGLEADFNKVQRGV